MRAWVDRGAVSGEETGHLMQHGVDEKVASLFWGNPKLAQQSCFRRPWFQSEIYLGYGQVTKPPG